MFASNIPFNYIECSKCGCIQLENEDIDMTPHYPNNYYSYNEDGQSYFIKDFLGKQLIKYKLGQYTLIGFLMSFFMKQNQSWIRNPYLSFQSKILDIGCGSGRLLKLLSHRGFQHLIGVEPYNNEEIHFENKVVIHNHTIFDHQGQYDFIMMHYSLEHMANPHEVMKKVISLLAEKGTLLIRIPILDCYAYRKYGEKWVQMDAPRHIYLYTLNSFLHLCEQHSLQVKEIIYDSSEYQFIQSEKYRNGLAFNDALDISRKERKNFNKWANHLNSIKDGDQVSFYLKTK
jgi:2-polyprenyl-3-methyl-5-hydroxy-6-metoxy-1,4-benzoquinol methylase